MSKVSLAGNASGTGIFTIASPNSNTDQTLTLPDNTGTLLTSAAQSIPSSALPAGSVLQVVQATTVSSSSTTATAFVTTGFSASITPKFSTSKIMVIVGGNIDTGSAALQGDFNIFRGATALTVNGFTMGYSISGRVQMPIHINYLDSPATTSSTTYTLYFGISSGSGTLIFNGSSGYGGQTATITLMEIAA